MPHACALTPNADWCIELKENITACKEGLLQCYATGEPGVIEQFYPLLPIVFWSLCAVILFCYGIAIYAFIRALVLTAKLDIANPGAFESKRFLKYVAWAFAFSFLALGGSNALKGTLE